MRIDWIRRRALAILLFLTLVALHVTSARGFHEPIMIPDEVGYLSNARYLGGGVPFPDLSDAFFYQFGYSLVIAPVFRVTHDPLRAYALVLVVNAVLTSSAFLAFRQLVLLFFDVPAGVASAIAFVASLYPPVFMNSWTALSENAFVPAFAFVIASLAWLLVRKTYASAIGFAALVAWLNAVHPRAFPILLLAVCFLAWFARGRLIPVSRLAAAGGTLAALVIATRLLNHHLLKLGYGGEAEHEAGQYISALGLLGGRAALKCAIGQAWYLAVATAGLVPIGVAEACRVVRRGLVTAEQDPSRELRGYTLLFLLGSAIGVLGASVLVITHFRELEGQRFSDQLVYGRINDGFVGPFLCLALGHLYMNRDRAVSIAKMLAGPAAAMGVLWLLLALARDPAEWSDKAEALHVAGLGLFIRDHAWWAKTGTITLSAIAVFVCVVLLGRRSFFASLAALSGAFLVVTGWNRVDYRQPHEELTDAGIVLIKKLESLGDVRAISFDLSGSTGACQPMFYATQYLFPNVRAERFASGQGESPRSPAVIADLDWKDGARARFVASDERGVGLWVRAGTDVALPAFDYHERLLGVEDVERVWKWGFSRVVTVDGTPVRWMGNSASLRIPIEVRPAPKALRLRLKAAELKPAQSFQVRVNGDLLFDGLPENGWKRSFDLSAKTLGDTLTVDLACRRDENYARRRCVALEGVELVETVETDSGAIGQPQGP